MCKNILTATGQGVNLRKLYCHHTGQMCVIYLQDIFLHMWLSSLLLPITVFFGFCCAEYTIDSDADFDPSFDLRLHNTAELLFKSSKPIDEDRE